MSVVAGIFLFLFSLLLMNILFPNILSEVTAMQVGALQKAGRSEAEISAFAALQTPLIQAAQGFIGTVITGLVSSLLIAIFLRKKQ